VERTWEPDADRSGEERDTERVWFVDHHKLVGGEEDQEGREEDLNGEGGGLRLQSETAGLPLSGRRWVDRCRGCRGCCRVDGHIGTMSYLDLCMCAMRQI